MSKKVTSQGKKLIILTLVLWAIVHVFLSINRSLWMDELSRFEHLDGTSFLGAMRGVFGEASPFAPGEIAFLWVIKKIFGSWVPLELWLRSFSILCGGLTLWLGFQFRQRFLMLPLFFSVGLTSFSTQARPYSALIFAGAMAFRLIWERRPLSRFENALAWATIFFTHLYGICYIGMAAVLRRERAKAVAAALWVGFILIVYSRFHDGRVTTWSQPVFPPIQDVLKQCLGLLGNPHKASYFLAPLFALGATIVGVRQKAMAVRLALLLLATVAAPLAATYLGGYFFVSRQVAGGIVPFLFLACLGLDWAVKTCKRFRIAEGLAWAALSVVSVVPWTLSSVLQIPPLGDMPFHRYKPLVDEILEKRMRDVLVIDVGGTWRWYLTQRLGQPDTEMARPVAGVDLNQICWTRQALCVHSVQDTKYLFEGPSELERSKAFARFLESRRPRFELILHNFTSIHLETTVPVARTW